MSSNTVILTSRNQNASIPNQYVYQFPSTQQFKDHEVALVSVSLYNSFFNIDSSRFNNVISFTFNALLPTVHQFTFSSGFYNVSDINYALQNFCILNNLYMVDSTNSKNVYFFEVLSNSISYAAQLNFYPIPTSAQAATNQWIKPVNAIWNFPLAAATPQVTIGEQFGELLGFNAATYPPSALNANQQYLSSYSPTISPISSVFLTTNLVSSPYSNPSNIIGTTAITSAFGDLILMKNSTPIFLSIIPSSYSSIEINLTDQLFAPLQLRDKEVVIVLVIREKFQNNVN